MMMYFYLLILLKTFSLICQLTMNLKMLKSLILMCTQMNQEIMALYKKHTLSDEEAANELAELVPKGRGSGAAAASSSRDGGGCGGTVHLVVS